MSAKPLAEWFKAWAERRRLFGRGAATFRISSPDGSLHFCGVDVSPDWAWHDIGEFDFSELQKIPLPTLDGLVLFVQGEVELDRIEISAK